MPSLINEIKEYQNVENQHHIDSDIHAITEKCGIKLKEFVGNDVRMSESKSAAVALTKSLREHLTRDTTTKRSGARRRGSSQKPLTNADYASCARMEQSKWLAAKHRPAPPRELPPRARPKREDVVRRFREKADRYADVVMKKRDQKMKDVDGIVHEVPFNFLSKEDLHRYDIVPDIEPTHDSKPSEITLLSLTSDTNVSTRTDLDPDKIVDKCLKECVSIFDVPVSTDPIKYAPKAPVVYYNVNSGENDVPRSRKIKSMFTNKKKSSNSQTSLIKEKEIVEEVREPLSKTIQKIFEKQEAFMNDCNKILNPSTFEFSQVLQSLSTKQKKCLDSEKDQSINSNQILKDFITSKRDLIEKKSFLNNIGEHLIKPETPKSVGDTIRSSMLSSRGKTDSVKYSRESNSSIPSYISSKIISSKGTNSQNETDSEVKKLFTKDQISLMSLSRENLSILSGTSTRCKLAQDVFSWKTTKNQAKSFTAEDFHSEYEDDATRNRKPVLNLKFYSDHVDGHADEKEIKPIKLQKSSTLEVQIPIIESQKSSEDGIKLKKKREVSFTKLSDVMGRKVLSQKLFTQEVHNTPLTFIRKTLKNDGVEVRMRTIPEVSIIKSKRMNYFSLSKAPLEDHKPLDVIHHTKLIQRQYMHSLRVVAVQ